MYLITQTYDTIMWQLHDFVFEFAQILFAFVSEFFKSHSIALLII